MTHPFHPKRGTVLTLRTRRQNWGEDRALYFDDNGCLRSMLTSWTSIGELDAFTQASAGRSWFRPDDLQRLDALVAELLKRRQP
ncbi:DUF5372 family protein [Steroidobacter sp.]|uniref:DUF5372 family protein n=1 Tax=Steroidobacter sp. TaxID=1978227 RepID=UPI0032C23566